ncbi:aminodeoxychorismate/anthranilate synthase component II [Pseudactinotalea sp. HY158]|uniref:anthranilate synthase component II n=1 Tax=Pseudactinotalea sp. HY158 TaxID=2654547 RepID=UPI00129CA051|nr:aminodeoxychorismate/anthranilate synthase component II [Pseudactinotalea sp. HY158]QGH68135.1 aminodeoxychorismate/anthranilate synthase component II [Pseudactinotalea sp. HY158]
MRRVLVVDNYDSFVFTIVGYLEQLGAVTQVLRCDDAALTGAYELADAVLVSPGPGTPAQAGRSEELIAACARDVKPLLGVCLGHQALAEVFGAEVGHAPQLMHGRTSRIQHDGTGVFAGLPAEMVATRYHSLAVRTGTVPGELRVTATTPDGVIMGLAHRQLPLHGVQFHPESVLTTGGHRLLANWLELAGVAGAVETAEGLSPGLAAG